MDGVWLDNEPATRPLANVMMNLGSLFTMLALLPAPVAQLLQGVMQNNTNIIITKKIYSQVSTSSY